MTTTFTKFGLPVIWSLVKNTVYGLKYNRKDVQVRCSSVATIKSGYGMFYEHIPPIALDLKIDPSGAVT